MALTNWRKIQLLDLVDGNGYNKTYIGLTNSVELSYVNGLSSSSPFAFALTQSQVFMDYYKNLP